MDALRIIKKPRKKRTIQNGMRGGMLLFQLEALHEKDVLEYHVRGMFF